jgi:2-polyprenyl-3-methyl-5-hydroxy-6-metoxy-1,4-benzoquinol methylase
MSLIKKLFFNLKYLGNPPWDTGISPPELLAYIHDNQAGKALDFGCGTGTNCITLAANGWDVVGIDFVRMAIVKAKEKTKKAGVQVMYRVGGVRQMQQLSDPFDLILDIGCFHSLNQSEKIQYLTHIRKLLKPEGNVLLYALIVSDSNPKIGLKTQDFDLLFSRLSLVDNDQGIDRGRKSAWFKLKNTP